MRWGSEVKRQGAGSYVTRLALRAGGQGCGGQSAVAQAGQSRWVLHAEASNSMINNLAGESVSR